MPIAWHSKRWWNFCMSENEKKDIEPIFAEALQNCASVVYNIGGGAGGGGVVMKHFGTKNCA